MTKLRAALYAAALLSLVACNATHDDLSRTILQPQKEWLVEPTDLGLDAEAFEVQAGEATLLGYLVRSPQANGRTVVLFHDRTGNVSALHPYLTFLSAAGLNVCAFDYRGFGKSTGEASLRGMFLDVKHVLDWLSQQRGVDPTRIGYYGIGLGSAVALRAARFDAKCKAILLDEAHATRDFIVERAKQRGELVSAFNTGVTEMALPENTDPGENAAALAMTSMWLIGSESPAASRVSTLRAWFEMQGDKSLVALRGAGSPPNSLLTHDSEYQRTVAQFFLAALEGTERRVSVTSRAIAADASGKGKHEIEIRLAGLQATAEAPMAIEVAAFDAEGNATWGKAWLESLRGRITLDLPVEPAALAATIIGDAEAGDGATIARKGTPLSRAGAWLESKRAEFTRLSDEPPPADVARSAAQAVRERESFEPMPPAVEAELVRVYYGIGRALSRTGNAEDRAAAIVWLQRAIAAAPKQPERHWWAGSSPHFGFDAQDAVSESRALLGKLTGN